MNALVVAAAAGTLFFLGYVFYSRIIARLYGTDASRTTPAHEKYDGVDYVPAQHWTVLFGHHFSSIAGAAPVVGPILALAYWGWVPTIIWIVLGSIFIGGVHDFGSLMASARHGASSIAHIAEALVSRRARVLFSLFIWLTLVLIIAVFAFLCSTTLVEKEEIVIPSFGLIPVAILTGYLLYKRKTKQVPTTVLGLGLLAALIVLGNVAPVGLGDSSLQIWLVVLLVYSLVASVTPVNILLQPRDYLSAFLLFIGLVVGYAGLVASHPSIKLPAFLGWKGSGGPLWPALFVTVACGAISGFHSLIASGTTSKQLANERYARRIGYGAMIAEGLVAALALLVVACGFAKHASLTKILEEGGGPIAAFGQGFSVVTKPILHGFGGLVAMTILNAFILTTLDSATRITRYLTQELFGIKSRILATVLPVALAGWLAWGGRWKSIWPLFGASNQLVAALALMVITFWLLSRGKPTLYTLLPGILMLATTVGALTYGLIGHFRTAIKPIPVVYALDGKRISADLDGLIDFLETERQKEETAPPEPDLPETPEGIPVSLPPAEIAKLLAMPNAARLLERIRPVILETCGCKIAREPVPFPAKKTGVQVQVAGDVVADMRNRIREELRSEAEPQTVQLFEGVAAHFLNLSSPEYAQEDVESIKKLRRFARNSFFLGLISTTLIGLSLLLLFESVAAVRKRKLLETGSQSPV